jgi:hypothetical protein
MTTLSNSPTLSVTRKPTMSRQIGSTQESLLEAAPRRKATAFVHVMLGLFVLLATATLFWALHEYGTPTGEVIEGFAFPPLT